MKRLVSHLVLVAAFLLVAPRAAAQTLSDDLVGDAVDTTAGTVTELTQSVSVGDLSTDLGGAVSTTEQTATGALDAGTAVVGALSPSASTSGTSSPSTSTSGSSGGSGSSSRERAGGKASPGKEARTRFDSLPPRLERLLERIELGRNVRANLRRLEEALVSLSARERARVLRLLNAEIRRLRADGVSPTERKRIARLLRAREEIAAPGTVSPGTASPATDPPIPAAADGTARGSSARSPLAGGVLDRWEAGRVPPPAAARVPTEGGPAEPPGRLEAGGLPLRIVLAVGAVLLVILAGLALKEERPA